MKVTLQDRILLNVVLAPAFMYFIYPNEFTRTGSIVWIIFMMVLINRASEIID